MRAAHTVSVASPPDSDTKMSAERTGFWTSGCFMRASMILADKMGTKKGFGCPKPFGIRNNAIDYLIDVLMLPNLVLRVVPRPFTAVMIASAMPAAIRAVFNSGGTGFVP